MIISESRKFIFIKTSRTASTSLQIALEKFCQEGDHAARFNIRSQKLRAEGNFNAIKGYSHVRFSAIVKAYFDGKDRLDEYFKCCFIRNPFSRMLSKFWGTKKVVDNVLGPEPWDLATARPAFSDWCVNNHLRSCYEFVCYKGQPRMNYIGRFEHLQADYERLCWVMNIPCLPLPEVHVHRKLKTHYSEMYTPAARAHIEKICRADLEAFGYEFEKP